MRIKSVHIRNFRCIQDIDIKFNEVTSFIGPNGAGKSTVLRALDWFFNGDKTSGLTQDDLCTYAEPSSPISVSVTFDDLNHVDREALGSLYAPEGTSTFSATRTWFDGEDKTTGSGRTLPDFDVIRSHTGKADRRKAYATLADSRPELALPTCKTGDEVDAAMKVWESDHPEQLEHSDIPTNHFFGFNGQNVLSGIFDYVFVSADLRANEQSVEGRKTILSRILERALERASLDDAYAQLSEDFGLRQAEINSQHLDEQLGQLGRALSAQVSAFAVGRQVNLAGVNSELKPSPPSIQLTITDRDTETSIDRQGHGFQRTLLISALKLLADTARRQSPQNTIALAIEEPELFQHPTQSRVFAGVLRSLASTQESGIQVAYATHSPLFVDAAFFDQVRRVTRMSTNDGVGRVKVHSASMEDIKRDLDGFVATKALMSRWDQVCTSGLAEALFSEAVVLVEGPTDKAIVEGAAYQAGGYPLEKAGISVAEAGSKNALPIPHAILTRLGVRCLVVFDNDVGSPQRAADNASPGKGEDTVSDARRKKLERDERQNQTASNKKLLQYMNQPATDFPAGLITDWLYAFEDNLEHVLARDWPQWEHTRQAIVSEQRGAEGKNAATYKLASREATDLPGGPLAKVLEAARSLVTVETGA